MKNVMGFTLIEMMIVVVIIAILASVAYPSYQNSIRKTNRTDAKESLTRIAALQERYFFSNNGYATTLGTGATGLGLTLVGGVYVSPEEHYNISLAAVNGGPTCGAGANAYPCFSLTATPRSPQQLKDTQCATLSITHTGNKTATGSGTDEQATKDCW